MATVMTRHQARHRAPSPKRGIREWALLVLEVLLAVGAYGGAVMMTLVQPDDFLPPEWRTGTPFRSWVLPGLVLLIANGIVPTIALVGAVRRAPWATLAHVAVGGVLVGWIIVQLLVIGLLAPAFQLGYLVLGLVILGLGLAMLRNDRRAPTA